MPLSPWSSGQGFDWPGRNHMETNSPRTLGFHLQQVKEGKRRYENAFQTVARMILENNELIEKVVVNGKSTYNFKIFRLGN